MHQIGDVIFGRYRILDQVSGGMSEVYKADDIRGNTKVAIKTVDPQQHAAQAGITPAEIEARFHQEVTTHGRLRHRSIPRIHADHKDQGRLYLVMDWIDGVMLRDWLNTNRANHVQTSQAETLDMARQLLEVLEYLHGQRQPIIYRDLKPENIMRCADGSLKLIDFGIVKELLGGGTRLQTNKLTAALGTAGYAPIEIYGGTPITRTDIYSLGWILAEILTGISPDDAMHATATPPPFPPDDVRKVRTDVCAEFAALIAQATKPDAKDRPHAAEMLREIARIHLILNPPVPTAFSHAGQRVGQVAGGIAQGVGGVTHVAGSVLGGAVGVVGAVGSGFAQGTMAGISNANYAVARGISVTSNAFSAGAQIVGQGVVKSGQAVHQALSQGAVMTGLGLKKAGSWTWQQVKRCNPLPLLVGAAKRCVPRNEILECQTYLDPAVYTWHDAGKRAHAEAQLQAVENAQKVGTKRAVIHDRLKIFWQLLFQDQLASLGIAHSHREHLSSHQEPGGFCELREPNQITQIFDDLLGRSTGQVRMASPHHVPKRILDAATKIVHLENPGAHLERIGITHYDLGHGHEVCELHVLASQTWYEVHV